MKWRKTAIHSKPFWSLVNVSIDRKFPLVSIHNSSIFTSLRYLTLYVGVQLPFKK